MSLVDQIEKHVKSTEEKRALVKNIQSQLDKQFGKGTLMQYSEGVDYSLKSVSSGSIGLDRALGVGGFPQGRIIEIYGPESAGKTTIALHAIAEVQKVGGIAAFIDAEHALDPGYAAKLGVDIGTLWISQPDNGEQALSIVDSLVRSKAVDIIVVDSVAALTPQAEIEGDMGDSHMGLQARLMSQALRKLTGIVDTSGVILIFINQIRMKIGVMFGNPETTTGGNALKFYSSIRLDVRKIESVSEGQDNIVANKIRVKVVKNKVAPPYKKAEMQLTFGHGIDRSDEVVEYGVQTKVIEKSGSWYSYMGERLGQGRNTVVKLLDDNQRIRAEIETKIKEVWGDSKVCKSEGEGTAVLGA